MDGKDFLAEQTHVAKRLYMEASLANWNAMASGKEEDYKHLEEVNLAAARYYNDKQRFEKVLALLRTAKEPMVRRQLELLYVAYLSEQGDMKVREELIAKSAAAEKKFNTFRATIDGKQYTDNDVKDVLEKETDDKKLHAAWEASKKQGELVAADVIELVKLRNKLARDLGFDNYYVFSLKLQEQTEEQVAAILDELARLTEEPFRKLKKEIDAHLSKRLGIPVNELKPWHYQNPFFQEGPEIYPVDMDGYYSKDILSIARDFYSNIGLPVETILAKSDLYEREGKYQHAFCMDMDSEGEVRIMQSMKGNEYWMETTLHELGHAVHFKYMDKQLPWLVRRSHTLITESISQLFGRQSKNKYFLEIYGNIDATELQRVTPILKNSLRLRMLVFSRWLQVMFHFERALYKDPDQDLNKLWWELVQKYQLLHYSRDKPDWASKIHLVSSPVYYHNYLLGELLSSQHHHNIMKLTGAKSMDDVNYIGRKEVGKYLKEGVFALGESLPWDELIEKATGERLNPEYFVEQFAR